jgi:hypothetical protein
MDVLEKLVDLHHQATTEHSHYYTASVIREAMEEIAALRLQLRAAQQIAPADGSALALLRRLREWDQLPQTGDGPYWMREIDAALADAGRR